MAEGYYMREAQEPDSYYEYMQEYYRRMYNGEDEEREYIEAMSRFYWEAMVDEMPTSEGTSETDEEFGDLINNYF